MRFTLLADASLTELDLAFPPPFQLMRYQSRDELLALLPKANGLLCRSTLKVDRTLLQESTLSWLLTASSGRDHLDEPLLQAKQIQVLDAKGANANAVGDYVLACLSDLILHRGFQPKRIAIIGYGEVGRRLYHRLCLLGFTVLTYDPMHPGPNHTEIAQFHTCDLICIHANLHHSPPFPSANLIDADFLKRCSQEQVIINAARGGLVNESVLLTYQKGIYCTDVFLNEPDINPDLVQYATLCTPHIAGHTIEAKMDAIRLLSQQLHRHFGLPAPHFPPHPKQLAPLSAQSWEALALAQYNPIYETNLLKSSCDGKHLLTTIKPRDVTHPLREAFLQLRAAHLRHGFEHHFA